MAYIKTVIVLLLSLGQILSPIWASLFRGEDSFFENWSPDQTYAADYAVEVKKNPNRDFVILNLTDIQLEKWEAQGEYGKLVTKTVNALVEQTKPDLITVTGDNGYSTSGYLQFVKELDAFGIPWAPIMGNHDGSCCVSEFWCAHKLWSAKNCLFRFGPKGMGYGNYVISITENGRPIHTMLMLDTHGNSSDEPVYFHDEQLAWTRWVLEGVTRTEGRTVESSALFHIPLPEFKTAYDEAYDSEQDCFAGEYADTSFGWNHEDVCCGPAGCPMFGLLKELGTKNVICGHDHNNCSSIVYQGVRLTYALHTGPGGYYEEGMNGGTVLTVHSDGSMNIEHRFVEM